MSPARNVVDQATTTEGSRPGLSQQQREEIRQAIQSAREAAQEARQQAQQQALDAHAQAMAAAEAARDAQRIVVHTGQPSSPVENMIPPQAVDISIAFFVMCAVIIVGWPIARAFGRRIERRGQVATLDQATADQLRRIEQAMEAMSIEVERISESQRFMARLQSQSTPGAMPVGEPR